jgi:hypothetical protein
VVIVSLISFNPCDCLISPKQSKTIPASLYYQESSEVSVQEQSYALDTETTNYGYTAMEDDLVKYEGYPSYHTLNPTFDLLVDWTLDYADAVDLAGGMTRVSIGVESMISEDFVFVSPDIGPLSKNDYISLMNYYQYNGLDFASAIPDLTVSYEGWHQDPHDPWRIWAVARYSGTHTGTARLPGSGLTLSPHKDVSEQKRFTTGPELQSFKWTPSKKVVFQTVGYIGDEITGSGQGHGSIHGLLVSMGLPPLYLETTESIRNVQIWFSQFLASDDAPRMKSPYSYLPQWWHERMKSENNIQR